MRKDTTYLLNQLYEATEIFKQVEKQLNYLIRFHEDKDEVQKIILDLYKFIIKVATRSFLLFDIRPKRFDEKNDEKNIILAMNELFHIVLLIQSLIPHSKHDVITIRDSTIDSVIDSLPSHILDKQKAKSEVKNLADELHHILNESMKKESKDAFNKMVEFINNTDKVMEGFEA